MRCRSTPIPRRWSLKALTGRTARASRRIASPHAAKRKSRLRSEPLAGFANSAPSTFPGAGTADAALTGGAERTGVESGPWLPIGVRKIVLLKKTRRTSTAAQALRERA
jgi:hypothetical protein